jgi:hypothetical protein
VRFSNIEIVSSSFNEAASSQHNTLATQDDKYIPKDVMEIGRGIF